MTIPPTTINKYIDHVAVLRFLCEKVKTSLPESYGILPSMIQCPLCAAQGRAGRLETRADFIGGAWYFCPDCGFAGDSVDIYSAVNELDSVKQAIEHMLASGIPVAKADAATVDYYVNTIAPERETYDMFWKRAVARISAMLPAGNELMQHYGVYGGYPAHSGTLMGCAHRSDIDKLPTSIQFKLKGHSLVLSLQDMPGRHKGFYFMSAKKRYPKELNIRPGGDMTYSDMGLAFLDRLRLDTTVVYAIADPVIALQLHIYNAMLSDDISLPVVAWFEGTTYSWRAINAAEIILWDYDVTDQLQTTALKLKNARIATEPRITRSGGPAEARKRICAEGALQFLAAMRKSATDPVDTLRDRLISCPKTAGTVIAGMELSGNQTSRLIQASEEKDKPWIKGLLYSSDREVTVEVDGSTLVDRSDGWYVLKGSDAKCITHVKLIPEKIIRLVKTNETRCLGKISSAEKTICFDADLTAIRKDVCGWLETKCLDNGLGCVVAMPKWKRQLFDIGVMFYAPEQIVVDDTVGWNPDKKWWSFPRFKLAGIAMTPADVEPSIVVPCAALEPVTRMPSKAVQQLLENSSTHRAYWAIMAVILHNLLAPVANWQLLGLGVISDDVSGHPVCRWLAAALQLVGLAPAPGLEPEAVAALSSKYGVPTTLDAGVETARLVADLLRSNTRANIIFPVTALAAELGSAHDNCFFLPKEMGIADRPELPHGIALIPAFLYWFQQQKQSIPGNMSSFHAVFVMLSTYLVSEHGASDLEVLSATEHLLLSFENYRGQDFNSRLLRTLFSVMMRLESGASEIVVIEDSGTTVKLNAFLDVLKQLNCPEPTAAGVLASLKAEGALLSVTECDAVIDAKWWATRSQDFLTPLVRELSEYQFVALSSDSARSHASEPETRN